MNRPSFRSGLALGILGGALAAVARMVQGRNEGHPAAPAPSTDWPPLVERPAPTAAAPPTTDPLPERRVVSTPTTAPLQEAPTRQAPVVPVSSATLPVDAPTGWLASAQAAPVAVPSTTVDAETGATERPVPPPPQPTFGISGGGDDASAQKRLARPARTTRRAAPSPVSKRADPPPVTGAGAGEVGAAEPEGVAAGDVPLAPPARPVVAPTPEPLVPDAATVDAPDDPTVADVSASDRPVRQKTSPTTAAASARTPVAKRTAAAPPVKKPAVKKQAARKRVEPPPPWVEPADGGTCPGSHPIKAKLSSRIFHLPGMFAYDRTRADRCYVDEAAATADGLRAAKR